MDNLHINDFACASFIWIRYNPVEFDIL